MVPSKRNVTLVHTSQFARSWIIAKNRGVALVLLVSIHLYKCFSNTCEQNRCHTLYLMIQSWANQLVWNRLVLASAMAWAVPWQLMWLWVNFIIYTLYFSYKLDYDSYKNIWSVGMALHKPVNKFVITKWHECRISTDSYLLVGMAHE